MYRTYIEVQRKMSGKLQIGVIISSTRENRLADRVVKFVTNEIEKEHNVVIFGKFTFPFVYFYIYLGLYAVYV